MSGGESVKAEVSVTDDGGSSGDQQVELDGRRETRDDTTIPIGALNVGYSAGAAEGIGLEEVMAGGWTSGGAALSEAVCENSNDSCSLGPVTPQRAPEQSPGTPLTPLANLKILIAAASSALDRERGCGGAGRGDAVAEATEETSGRKMKSLAILCKKFLSIVEGEVGEGNEFSLDMMSQSLGTNRRRIYDIINVMEAVEMIVKQSKNWYTWSGRGNLIHTLAKLRAMALDDAEFKSLFEPVGVCTDKENIRSTGKGKQGGEGPRKPLATSTATNQSSSGGSRDPGHTSSAPLSSGTDSTEDASLVAGDAEGGKGGGGRWDKSLGVLCQRFIMLFLISPAHEVTLEFAGSILMPDDMGGGQFSATQPTTNQKSKVRRLYDIANVLTTLELIKKKTFMAPNHRKMPGYSWCGPSIADIEAISVSRKTEVGLGTLYPAKKGGVALTRKPSFSNRPFLHQYETQCADPHSSSTTKEKSSRRSLSFGSSSSWPPIAPAPASSAASCVVARPLSQKQLEVMNEVKEFEAEMQKHSHRYPHVASIFHEFIKKYQSSLEQSSSTGRILLPKPTTPAGKAAPVSVPVGTFSPIELVAKTLLSSPNALQLVKTTFAQTAGGSFSPTSPEGPSLEGSRPDMVALPLASASGESTLPSSCGGFSSPLARSLGVTTVGDVLAIASPSLPSTSPTLEPPHGSLPASTGRDIEQLPPSNQPSDLTKVTELSEPAAFQSSPVPLTCSPDSDPLQVPATPSTLPPPSDSLLPPIPQVATEHVPTSSQVSESASQSGVGAVEPANQVGPQSSQMPPEPSASPSQEGMLEHVPSALPSKGGLDTTSPSSIHVPPPLTQTWTSLAGGLLPDEFQLKSSSAAVGSVSHSSSCGQKNTVLFASKSSPPPLVSTSVLSGSHPTVTSPPLPASSLLPQVSTLSAFPLRTKPRKASIGTTPPSRLRAHESPRQATSGTLQSPTKPAQEFVNVEHFLIPATTQGNGKEKSPNAGAVQPPSPQDMIHMSLRRPYQSVHLSPPSGVLCLPQTFADSRVAPSQPPMAFVNQHPIPSASENAQNQPRMVPVTLVPPLPTQLPSSSANSAFHPGYGVVNPNLFLSSPAQPVAPGLFLSTGGPAVYPIDSNVVLPPFTTMYPGVQANGYMAQHNLPLQVASSSSGDQNKEVSPPKRLRLE